MAQTTERYTKLAIWLHWIIAILIIFMLFPGEELMEVERGGSLADWQPSAHASIGILVLILSIIRILWRVGHAPPPLPAGMPAWQVTATHALHGLFYLLMIGLPLSGWLALMPYGADRVNPEAVSFFKLFSLYMMPNLGDWTMEAHELAGTLAKLLLFLHVAAALKHQFWDKDGLMKRISPH